MTGTAGASRYGRAGAVGFAAVTVCGALAAFAPAPAVARTGVLSIRPHSITGWLVKPGSLPGGDITPGTLSPSLFKPGAVAGGLTVGDGVLQISSSVLAAVQRPVSFTPGAGITLSPNPLVSSGSISVDFGAVQARVTGTPCPAGQAVSAIAQSGSATCTPVGAGVSSISAGGGIQPPLRTRAVALSLAAPLSLSGTAGSATSGVITGSARGAGAGVAGVNQSTSGYGGYFKNDLGTGLYGLGQNAGVKGEAGSGGGAGVYGSNGTTYGYGGYFDGGTGVYATNAGTNSLTPAGEFVVASSPAKVANEEAVYASSGLGDGVQGFTYANSKAGVSGTDVSTDGGYGGYFASQQGTALYAAGNATITGNLTVSGSISAGTKDFRIDDPLDPANEYLIHTSVESPDMLDLYSGNVRTDARGFATVALPRYFQALNGDFRYQLTAVGRDGWNARVGVWQPVARNRFVIRSDRPHVEVSWQVTGVRHDAYANAHRGPAETPKPPADRGRYLYPQGFGKPSRLAIGQ